MYWYKIDKFTKLLYFTHRYGIENFSSILSPFIIVNDLSRVSTCFLMTITK